MHRAYPLRSWLLLALAIVALPGTGGLSAQEARVHVVEPAGSRLWVVTHRAGLLSFLGHEHAILATDWEAELCLAPSAPEHGRARFSIRTAGLVADADSVRALAGLGDGPGEDDRREIQERLLDADHLDATGHPEIVVETLGVRAGADGEEGSELDVTAAVSIRGTTREVEVPLRLVRLGEDVVRLEGGLEVRQSWFGIEPESIAGVVKVSDEVDLRFLVVARPTARSCDPAASPDP